MDRPARYVETPAEVRHAADKFGELASVGDDVDIAIDFHGAISPGAWRRCLSEALEPLSANVHRGAVPGAEPRHHGRDRPGTHLPIATGERVFTKWGFREVLEKAGRHDLAAGPVPRRRHHRMSADRGHGRGFYAAIAPHCPLGPIALAAGVQLAASIPNFLSQERRSLGDGYLKSRSRCARAISSCPRPGLGIELDENALADKIDTIGRIARNMTRTTDLWSIGEVEVPSRRQGGSAQPVARLNDDGAIEGYGWPMHPPLFTPLFPKGARANSLHLRGSLRARGRSRFTSTRPHWQSRYHRLSQAVKWCWSDRSGQDAKPMAAD